MILAVIFYEVCLLIDYFIWCKRSARSIAAGGACIVNTGKIHRIVDIIFMCCIFGGLLGWILLNLVSEGNWFILIISMAQFPILLAVFGLSVKYLKKKKVDAMVNKVISIAVIIIASFAYLSLILLLIIRLDFHTGSESNYRTVTWKLSPTESHDYRMYSDEIPLTCEDLYG